ncbi:4Fe-4S dicluster domain-containing protein [Vibrio sp. SS-MA-C1-2]|uniref:4Fe-4S dicluster domain-containing protein n=1 Tax=Vibrio sp. SS-MA-C1-2 TaxID=2908646 RepID=UPI001F3475B6|nr:4Fe-4S dicluster domain-containing protein [Vibrio sp. SS-MA-C1-2]UJF17040.1 4Fe-4S dicluster domain-containing protein [Vibrio sp. SS-MA-C1-2]
MRYGMVIDTQKCVGCAGCIFACKTENNTDPDKNWCDKIITTEGQYPNVKFEYTSTMCNHCSDAPCIANCPKDALYKDENDLTLFDSDKCIGCKSCMSHCPYNVIHFNEEATGSSWNNKQPLLPQGVFSAVEMRKTTGEEYSPFGNPETESVYPLHRPKNTIEKCTFCAHRVRAGVNPACVDACPSGARVVGDLDDINSEVSQLIKKYNAKPLNPDLNIGEKVFYIRDYIPMTTIEETEFTDAIVFDSSLCIGCSKCEADCRNSNQLPENVTYLNIKKEIIDGIEHYFRQSCQHCEHANCLDNCPADAISRRPGGQVVIDEKKCIGCGTCAMACPYDIPQYNDKTATMNKCHGCSHLTEAGLRPACVEGCPQQALSFGSREDLQDRVQAQANKEGKLIYGLDTVNNNVGELGLITIADKKELGKHLLIEDPNSTESTLRDLTKAGAAVGVAGAIAVTAAHRVHLAKKAKENNVEQSKGDTDEK